MSARCAGSGHAWCPRMSVARLASMNGGAWVRLPRLDADDSEPANFSLAHVSVESRRGGVEGAALLVIRGGYEASAVCSGASVRVANKTLDKDHRVVSVRQVARRRGNVNGGPWEPQGPWLSVESGRSVPWALANPLRVDDVEHGFTPNAPGARLCRRRRF